MNPKAICHDFRNMVSGTLQNITELGCELISDSHEVGPAFPKKTTIMLNVLNKNAGQSQNIKARLSGFNREDGCWVYRIKWTAIPEALL